MANKIRKCAVAIGLTAVMAVSLNGCGAAVEMVGAGVAIPATIGSIDSATVASAMTDASATDNACKTFYAGVRSGTIDSNSKNPDGTTVSAAPIRGATDREKMYAAKAATVYDSLLYSGLSNTIDVSQMVYLLKNNGTYSKGKILYAGDDKIKNLSLDDYAPLYLNTTLGELYN